MAQIPAKMKALVNHGPHDYRLEMIDTPMPGPNEVLIKVGACGICAGDIKCEAGAKMFWGENPWVKTPVVPGHEFFGTVVAMGEGAEEHFGVKMGERILAEQILPCGKCRFCKSGQYWMCQPHDMYGYQGKIADGGMAEYMLFHPNSVIHKIPDALSLEDAAFIEPMACSMHTTERANIQFEDVVVLAGAGTLGLGIVQAAALKHPKKLVVLDTIDSRLELAKKFGADVVINPAKEDALKAILDMTDGYGCDVYIEATGNPRGAVQGLEMTRKLGRFVEMSVFGADVTADWSIIGDRKELDILGAHLGPYCYDTVISLLERGLITSKGIVTHTFDLDHWKEGFETAHGKDAIKVILKP